MARNNTPPKAEYDSVYFLKILLYLIVGSLWLAPGGHRSIPLGLIIGILAVQHEKLQIDRKIEYAILLVAAVLGLVGIGLTIVL
jgi:hypothetical protein